MMAKKLPLNVLLKWLQENLVGCVGIAWIGTVCDNNPGLRTSVNEWFQSDLATAQVICLLSKFLQNLDQKKATEHSQK